MVGRGLLVPLTEAEMGIEYVITCMLCIDGMHCSV